MGAASVGSLARGADLSVSTPRQLGAGRRGYGERSPLETSARSFGASATPGTGASRTALQDLHYINRAMPYTNPGSLTANQVYAVTAYLLYMNKIIAERDQLDRHTLPKVVMPNRNGFIPDPRPDVQ
jgi:hypothetical protein